MELCSAPQSLSHTKLSISRIYRTALNVSSSFTKTNLGVSKRRARSNSSHLTLQKLPLNKFLKVESTGYGRNARITVKADATLDAAEPDPLSRRLSQFLDACWRFLRPHTIRGTVLGSVCVVEFLLITWGCKCICHMFLHVEVFFVFKDSDLYRIWCRALVSRALLENCHLINWWLLPKALCGLIALICGNGYIVGINQIYDIGIDKVNKPFLPIAAGDLSVTEAWYLVLLFVAMGVAIVGINFGPFITTLYCLGLCLGTIYSVPPFRLKRFPVAAFLIIATVRGFLLNFGVYYATRAALGLTFQWSPSVVFITIFVTLFAMVIAITKDLPDVEGDRKFQISTLATRLGVRNIAFLGSGLLLANYVGAILAAVYMPQSFRHVLMVFGHSILALLLGFQTWILDQSKYTKEGIANFYRFIWNLFYAEYIMFPFI